MLSVTCVNNILYKTILYIDGIYLDDYEAKRLVSGLLGSPIWRVKTLGILRPMPHDAFWNIIFFINNRSDTCYTTLNAKYAHETLNIESRAGKQPVFLAINKDTYPLKAGIKIYEALGYTFSELNTTNLTHYQAFIGMTQTITLDIKIISQSIAHYLHNLRHLKTSYQL